VVLNELSECLVDLVGVDEVKHGPLIPMGGDLGALCIRLILTGTRHLVHFPVSVPVLLQGKGTTSRTWENKPKGRVYKSSTPL